MNDHKFEPDSFSSTSQPGKDDANSLAIRYDASSSDHEIVRNSKSESFQVMPKKKKKSDWVPPNTPVQIHHFTIETGMVYVGERKKVGYRDIEQCALIDPSLPIEVIDDLDELYNDGYWPSYDEIEPAFRGAYLDWLARGKDDPHAEIGYVLLYCYGLERRFFLDRPAPEELDLLIEEIKRLQNIYGRNYYFYSYVDPLLDAMLLVQSQERIYLSDYQFPVQIPEKDFLKLHLGLAQLIKDGQPLSADWALTWVCLANVCDLNTPAQRLPRLFMALFRHYFREKIGHGILLKPNRSTLDLAYDNPSSDFDGYILPLRETYPEPFTIRVDLWNINILAMRCEKQLEPLSRWIGRNPGQEDSLRALAMLPEPLFPKPDHPTLRAWCEWLKPITTPTVFSSNELIHRWPVSNPAKIMPRETTEMFLLLQRLGYGVEPDWRFNGPKALKPDVEVVLFPLTGGTLEEMTEAYRTATTMLHLAMKVALADGQANEGEIGFLQQQIDDNEALGGTEKHRLKVHLLWLGIAPPKSAGLKLRIQLLTHASRHKIGDVMLRLATADGPVAPKEIKLLEKLFKNLGLDVKQVIDKVHQASTTAKDRVRSDGARPKASKGFQLDQATLEIKRLEGQNVSKLLGHIFEESAEEVVAVPGAAEEVAEIEGLDAAHTALLHWLGKAETRDREAVEAFCESLGIFPDGALEQINDIAFERCDAPLIEDDGDVLEIDGDVYQAFST